MKFKINNLLSGIITMTALLSINIALSKGRTLVPYNDSKTLFNNSFKCLNFEQVIMWTNIRKL